MSASAVSFAQVTSPDEPISTVRPRLTNTTRIVPFGHVQIEAGADIQFGGFSSYGYLSYDPFLVRYGAAPRLEIRFGAPVFTNSRFALPRRLGDLSVAASYFLGYVGNVALAIQPSIVLPTSAYSDLKGAASSISLTAEAPVGKGWSLASTLTYYHATHQDDFFGEDFTFETNAYLATLAAERALGTRASAFAELQTAFQNGFSPFHRANAGVRFRLSRREAVDLHAIVPIADGINTNVVGIGYSVRL